MTKYKSLTSSSIVVASIFLIHLISGAQFLNATRVGLLCAVVTKSPFTKI